jgi:hypothetical protein
MIHNEGRRTGDCMKKEEHHETMKKEEHHETMKKGHNETA